MYYVFVQELNRKFLIPSSVFCGWISSFDPLSNLNGIFDYADSFITYDEADKAAKNVGCKRYVILQVPVHCECRSLDENLMGDPDEWERVFEEF